MSTPQAPGPLASNPLLTPPRGGIPSNEVSQSESVQEEVTIEAAIEAQASDMPVSGALFPAIYRHLPAESGPGVHVKLCQAVLYMEEDEGETQVQLLDIRVLVE